jgi:TP901 family phage tail tape measure protein
MDVRGLQIDLGIHDAGVNRTITEIRRSFRNLNSDIKLSNRIFDSGEKSLSSYRSRVKELDSAVKVSEKNVKALATQYEKVAKESGANSAKAGRLKQEYNKQSTELLHLQQQLKATSSEYSKMERISSSSVGRVGTKFNELGPKIKSAGDAMTGIGRNMSTHVTAPITLGLGMAIKKSADFNQEMTKVGAIAGANGQELKAMKQEALDLGAKTSLSASEVAGGMKELASLGFNAKQSMQAMPGVISATEASGADLATTASVMASTINQFGMKAKDSGHIADVLAMSANKSAADIDYMGDALKYAGTPAHTLGMSLEDTSASIMAMSNAGLKGEQAGTTLRASLTRLASPTKQSKQAMDKLGISLTDSKGKFVGMPKLIGQFKDGLKGMTKEQKLATVSQIVGQESASGFLSLIDAGPNKIQKYSKSLKNSNGESAKTAKEMKKNLKGSLEQLGGAFETLGINIGDTLTPAIDKIAKVVTSLTEKFNKAPQGVKNFVTILAVLVASIGPIILTLGLFASAIGTITTVFGGLMTSMRVVTATTAIFRAMTISTSTIMNLWRGQLALTTILTGKYSLATKVASIGTRALGLAIRFMSGPVGWIITGIGLLVGAIIYLWKTNSTFRNVVINSWNAIKNASISVFGAIKNFIVGAWNSIKYWSIAIWNGIKNGVMTIIRLYVAGIKLEFKIIKTVVMTVINFIKTWSLKIWRGIKNGVMAIVRAYVNGVRNSFNTMKRVITTIITTIKNWSIKVWNILKNSTIRIVRALSSGARNIFNGLKNGIVKIISTLRGWMIKAWTYIKNKVVSLVRSLWNGAKNIFNSLSKGTRNIFNSVRKFLTSVWTSIRNKTVALARSLWNKARDIFNSLSKGTRNIFNGVRKFMASVWSSIRGKVLSLVSSLWSKVRGVFNSLSKGTRSIFNKVGNFLKSKWEGIKSNLTGIASSIKNKVIGTFGKMRDGLKNIIGKIGGFIGDMVDGVKKGLNKLIDGVNWVAGKLGMDKLPKLKFSTGTESTHTQNVVTNGKINRDTFATVGDRGKGNGPGGFRHEMIEYPNGKMAMTPNRDTTAYLPKGSKVYSGAQTHAMLSNSTPKFSKGTGFKEKLFKGWDATKKTVGNVAKGAESVAKSAFKGIGEVADYASHPGKLVNKVLSSAGVNFDFLGKKTLPGKMMAGMYKKLQAGVKSLFSGWLEDSGGGGDASKLLRYKQIQGFGNYTGGLSYNGGKHYGVDLAYPFGSNVYATNDGQLSEIHDFGGGKVARLLMSKFTLYFMHLSKVLKSGRVKAGDLIAKSGNSGNFTTGAHLHFQVDEGHRTGGVDNAHAIDPLKWLKGHGGASGKWSGNIKQALKLAGLPTSSAYVNAWSKQIQTESGGNAKALGGDDGLSDGRAKGLVQVKPGTFNAYKLPGHGNIWNGLDNLIAGMRYAKARYGKGGMLSAIGKGHGYATGGIINSEGLFHLAEQGYPEFIIPTDPKRSSDAMKLLAYASNKIQGKGKNKRPNDLRTPSNMGSNDDSKYIDLMAQQLQAQQEQINLLTQLVASTQNIERQPKGFNTDDVSKGLGSKAKMAQFNYGM